MTLHAISTTNFFYFIFIHATPFYSFFALRCWWRCGSGKGQCRESARSCSRCRQRSQRQKTYTHELISRARHAARDWAELRLYSNPPPSDCLTSACLTSACLSPVLLLVLPTSSSSSVVWLLLCFAFFSRLFSPLHLPFICMFVCDCIKRVVACSVVLCHCLCLSLSFFLYLPASSSMLPMTETETTTAQTRQLCCLANKFLAAFSILQNICCREKKL